MTTVLEQAAAGSRTYQELGISPRYWTDVMDALIHGVIDADEIGDWISTCAAVAGRHLEACAPPGLPLQTWRMQAAEITERLVAELQGDDLNPEGDLDKTLIRMGRAADLAND